MTVLIVDDSLLVLKKVESQIKDMADIDEIILCANPVQALDIIRQKNVDIVILDVLMPEMNGLELLTSIRQDLFLSDIQVIMLTSENEYLQECFNLGSDDFINKPIKSVELRTRIKSAIKTRKNRILLNEVNRELSLKNQELVKLNERLDGMRPNTMKNEKMASIGELAVSVMHEINNPLELVKSNADMLHNALKQLLSVIDVYRSNHGLLVGGSEAERIEYIRDVAEAEKTYKLDVISVEVERCLNDLQGGITQVSKIVSTLTSFVHANLDG